VKSDLRIWFCLSFSKKGEEFFVDLRSSAKKEKMRILLRMMMLFV